MNPASRRVKPPVIYERSAGGVVVRDTQGDLEYLAIKPAHRDRWQLPKGRIDPGEGPQEAAIREVREEGGVDAEIIEPLGPIRFFYQMDGNRYSKTVTFFLMRYRSGDSRDHDHEVQDTSWFPLQAAHRLAFPSERGLVDRASEILRQGVEAGA